MACTTKTARDGTESRVDESPKRTKRDTAVLHEY